MMFSFFQNCARKWNIDAESRNEVFIAHGVNEVEFRKTFLGNHLEGMFFLVFKVKLHLHLICNAKPVPENGTLMSPKKPF